MSAPDELDPLLRDARFGGEPDDAPADLAERVLAGLEPDLRELRLDLLLERADVDDAPLDLAATVLRGLAGERAALRPRPSRLHPARLLAAAAAVLLLAWLARSVLLPGGPAPDAPPELTLDADVDPELLASLDLLENWDLVTDDDLALLLAELDEVDAGLLQAAHDLQVSWDGIPWEEGRAR